MIFLALNKQAMEKKTKKQRNDDKRKSNENLNDAYLISN